MWPKLTKWTPWSDIFRPYPSSLIRWAPSRIVFIYIFIEFERILKRGEYLYPPLLFHFVFAMYILKVFLPDIESFV